MTSGAQNKCFNSMFEEIEYIKEILDSQEPSSVRPNCEWSEIARELDAVPYMFREAFAVRLTDFEQSLYQNTIRIIGLVEAPGENTLSLVLRYFRRRLAARVSVSDINFCCRVGPMEMSQIRPIVVEFSNDEARKSVWERKEIIKDSVYFYKELCYERNKVHQIALQIFDPNRVSVVDGAVQVIMNDGKEIIFSTLSQIDDFLKQADSLWF